MRLRSMDDRHGRVRVTGRCRMIPALLSRRQVRALVGLPRGTGSDAPDGAGTAEIRCTRGALGTSTLDLLSCPLEVDKVGAEDEDLAI